MGRILIIGAGGVATVAAHKVCQVAARLKSHKHLTDVFRRGDSCHAECSYADNIKY